VAAYTWLEQKLFLERNKLMQKQEGALCQVQFSHAAGCSVSGLEEHSKGNHCHHTLTASSRCSSLRLSTQPRDSWHQAQACAKGVIKSRIPSIFCTHTAPFPRWSCLQIKSHLKALQSEGKHNAQHGMQPDWWPATMCQAPQQPSSWSAAPSLPPNAGTPQLSCSMDALSKLC